MMRAVYATVEKVMRATDVKPSAFLYEEILSALESASEDVDSLIKVGDHNRPAFAPWTGSIAFDWPTHNNQDAYRFWLNQFRLHSLSSITSGGDDLTAQALLWPASGAPYSAIDIDTAGADSLAIGSTGTGQRALAIAGVWGIVGSDRSRSGWVLGASATSSAGAMTIDAPIGIGSLLLIGSERVIVTGRSFVDSGQTASALTANMAAQNITVSSGSVFLAGEDIVIDSERMIVREVIGNSLIVQRADGGSTLAEHANGAVIQWARSCAVDRAQLGTSAQSHSDGAAVSIYHPPALAEQLTIAYAIDRRAQENVGYARSLAHIMDRGGLSAKRAGGDVGAVGITALEERVISAYGRIRHRAI